MDPETDQSAPASNPEKPPPEQPSPLDTLSGRRSSSESEYRWHEGPKASANRSQEQDLSCDRRWIELLETYLSASSMLRIEVSRGRSDYRPLFDRQVVLLDGREARDEAARIGQEIYSECSRYTSRHGPVLDFQLSCFARIKGKTKLVSKDAIQSVRIDLTGDDSPRIDDDLDDPRILRSLLAHTTTQQREVRWLLSDFRAERKELVGVVVDLVKALPSALEQGAAVQGIGMELVRRGVDYNKDLLDQTVDKERRRLEAEFSIEKIRVVSETLRQGIEVFSGEGGALLQQWMNAKFGPGAVAEPPDDIPEAAKRFRAEMNMAQCAVIGDAAFGNLADILDQCAQCSDDATAIPLVAAAWQILEAHRDDLKSVLTPNQIVIVNWIKGRQSAWEIATGQQRAADQDP